MVDDIEFGRTADCFMESVFETLNAEDPDELDADLAMGVLTIEFADGTKCIMNRQVAAHQIWLAYGATAWHFAPSDETGEWMDTKGRGAMKVILAEVLSTKLGRAVVI